MTSAFIVSARRTAVTPRGGQLASIEVVDLAAACIRAVLSDAALNSLEVDDVILGNTLYGGGNPARLASLMAGLPESVTAMTLDSQCCAGLDAVLLAAARIKAGEADVVLAGGLESFSRAPIRSRRALSPGFPPEPYARPPFTPWPEKDPDMIPAAALVAEEWKITRAEQEEFAIESHRKTLLERNRLQEIVSVGGVDFDEFARPMDRRLCARLPVLAGTERYGVTAATVAVEADAAAVVMLTSDRVLARLRPVKAARLIGSARRGGDPERPALAPIGAGEAALRQAGRSASSLSAVEIMEAFAVQAIACVRALDLDPAVVNLGGGALARGHPIGASGSILAVRLWHEMASLPAGSVGMAAIAAAGGLASALLVEAV